MFPDLKGRGLFVFSDPGGAKPVLAFITMLKTLTAYKIVSDRTYSFFDDFGLDVERYKEGDELHVFENFKPDFLFTGTSYTSKIELQFVKEAKRNGVVSYSFIDHYTKFEERFLLNDVYVFPDNICVIDEKARKIGLETELPKDRFLVSGNFYHQWLRNWKPNIDKEAFFRYQNIPIGNKLLVYAPDPLSNVGGVEKYGTDEARVFKDIKYCLDELDDKSYTLFIKMHPNQKREILEAVTPLNDLKYIIADDKVDCNSLLFYSDMVIGIFSSILIESVVMNKKVLRCLIGYTNTDPLESNNIGIVVRSIDEMKHEFNSLFS